MIAGIAGFLAIFRPMISIGRGPVRAEPSAYELSFGLSKTHKLLDRKLPGLLQKRIPADVLQTRDDIKLVADASRGAIVAFIPGLLILLVGAYSVWRKHTGRLRGGLAGLLGLVSIGAWYGVRRGVAYGLEEEPALARLHFETAFGAQLLLAVGVLALVGAVLAWIESAPARRSA